MNRLRLGTRLCFLGGVRTTAKLGSNSNSSSPGFVSHSTAIAIPLSLIRETYKRVLLEGHLYPLHAILVSAVGHVCSHCGTGGSKSLMTRSHIANPRPSMYRSGWQMTLASVRSWNPTST